MPLIPGGFYIKARCIQDASIATQPPYVREIWDWLIKECNHTDTPNIKRGSCLKTYKDIQEGLTWFIGWRKMKYAKWQCEKAMLWLTKEAMVATTKTTRGLIISLVNYEKYQDGSNYESYKRATREIQTTETFNNKNDKNDKKEEEAFKLPDWINPATWQAYLEVRKHKRAAPTNHAYNLIIKSLEGFKKQGQDPNAILEKSIINSWTGVFPLKDNMRRQPDALDKQLEINRQAEKDKQNAR